MKHNKTTIKIEVAKFPVARFAWGGGEILVAWIIPPLPCTHPAKSHKLKGAACSFQHLVWKTETKDLSIQAPHSSKSGTPHSSLVRSPTSVAVVSGQS